MSFFADLDGSVGSGFEGGLPGRRLGVVTGLFSQQVDQLLEIGHVSDNGHRSR